MNLESEKERWKEWLRTVKEFYGKKEKTTNSIFPDSQSRSQVYKPVELNPILCSKPGDNRPYIEVEIFNDSINALLDSGSNVSILGNSALFLLKKYNLSLNYNVSVQVTTADGQVQSTLGFVHLPICLQGIEKTLKILIIPSITQCLILGMDFIQVFNISVNFCKNSFNSSSLSVSALRVIQGAESLDSDQKLSLNNIIELFKEIGPKDKIGKTHLYTHHIDTQDSKPIKQRQYPLSPAMMKVLNSEVNKMLDLGIIRQVTECSPWLSPLWLVKKKDGSYRVCFDGRKLNSITVADSYPMPLIDSVISKVRDAQYLSSLDLKQAFFQIPLDKESQLKTTFAVPGRGLFCFQVLPFGLHNSAQAMCRLMDMVIGPSLEPYVFYYIDDIVVVTPDFNTHVRVLKELHQKLRDAGLTVNFDKCMFCRTSLNFLGFVVDKHGLRTDPEKIQAVLEYPTPQNTTQVRRLIGLIGYYRRFLENSSSVCAPITDLLKGRKKGQTIVWTQEANDAFDNIKELLTSAPILASPDFSKRFFIAADASNRGVGGVLFQEEDGLEHPIAFCSKSLNKCQRNYTTTEKELLAIVYSVDKFRPYVEGTEFTVITDHSSLKWLNTMKDPSPRLARWIVKLSQHKFDIVHRSGSLNKVADSLSRIPECQEVAVLDLTKLKTDRWYRRMLSEVVKNPQKYPDFKVENDILYKHVLVQQKISDNIPEWKIVVPSPNRKEIMNMYHDDPLAAHLGVYKTISRVSLLYYWPRMRNSIKRYVLNCKVCASCKHSNLPQAGLMGKCRNISFPFQLLSADLLGPYPRSKHGNRYLLVVTDWFTKFVFIQPLAKATSRAIVKFLENNVFLIFGVPQIFVADNGPQFISREFKALMHKYKVQKIWFNARYFPQVNPTERVNKTIVTAIRSYIQGNHKSWDENIQKIAQAIRLGKHEVTKFSPSYLCFMRNVPTDGSFYGQISENARNYTEISKKVLNPEIQAEMPSLFEEIKKRLLHAHRVNSSRYNLRRRDVKFRVGDRVWRKNFVLSNAAQDFSSKLAPKYVPCIIRKVLSPLVYNLEDINGNDLGNFHVSHIKLDITQDVDCEDQDNN